ncbi:hypothetical protein PVBG_06177 [Plasmodium vivax Brazil I]|uniref:Uncharacterized protein n=1 Tax=Plasmodium vivax (strain Brazil I) TaxID=1033975 RepID=A0A0J9T426_PLAV1|nr:hypothetical protein PVBG_06177 [Plasmodium vivax Brazil I]
MNHLYKNNLSNNITFYGNVQNFRTTGDGFIKKKSLFLHGEILHWIVKAKEKINSKQSTSYYKYLGKCFNFYKRIKRSDNPSIKEEYGNELNTFESNFNIAISTLKEKRVKIRKEEITLPNTAICKLEWENVQETAEVQAGEQGAITDDTESVGLAPLTSIDPNVAGNNGDSSEQFISKHVGTIGATVAGSSLFLLMMYRVKKHIFNKYDHFMLIFILKYHSILLVKINYIFKYAYFSIFSILL